MIVLSNPKTAIEITVWNLSRLVCSEDLNLLQSIAKNRTRALSNASHRPSQNSNAETNKYVTTPVEPSTEKPNPNPSEENPTAGTENEATNEEQGKKVEGGRSTIMTVDIKNDIMKSKNKFLTFKGKDFLVNFLFQGLILFF